MTDITATTDLTALVNQTLQYTIPGMVGLGIGIMNAINHFVHSKKTDTLATETKVIGAKVDAYATSIVPKVDTAIDIASTLSPAVKDAIVKEHPLVMSLTTQLTALQNQVANLQNYINGLQGNQSEKR